MILEKQASGLMGEIFNDCKDCIGEAGTHEMSASYVTTSSILLRVEQGDGSPLPSCLYM